MRRSHDALTAPNLAICPYCKTSVPTHKVHKECLLKHFEENTPGRMPFA